MQINFDEAKNKSNMQKHGVPLSEAKLLEWDLLISAHDARRDYGEVREVGFAPMGERLYCVVFTVRDDTYHIISLRKANNREKAIYAHYY
jgi:uncharacterized DUF497 family protein